MRSWYKVVDDLELKDGRTIKVDRLVFKTTDKELSKRIEGFFKSLMDESHTKVTEPEAWQEPFETEYEARTDCHWK